MPKHVIISKLGGPEVLKYQEYNLPNEIKVNEVRIKQSSIGLSYIDTYHRNGIYPLPSNLPICPGMEAAGEVIEVGSEVVNFRIGDRVAYATPPIGAYCEIRDFPEEKLILTKVSPFSSRKFCTSLSCSFEVIFKVISLILLLNKSFKGAILRTLILFVLSSSEEIVLLKVKINDDPSFKKSLFNSKISENINNSKTLLKSVNFKTA